MYAQPGGPAAKTAAGKGRPALARLVSDLSPADGTIAARRQSIASQSNYRGPSRLRVALEGLLASAERFDYASVKSLAQPERQAVPDLAVLVPDLTVYDRLLAAGAS
jgi:hypothetical protein